MDIQYFGANCIVISTKQVRIVIDDNLKELGLSSILKPTDVVLFTDTKYKDLPKNSRITINCPGEYEIGSVSIYGIAARAHMDDENQESATIYKILTNDLSVAVLGHINPSLNDTQLESIGTVDVLCCSVGDHGYTMDAQGALKVVKEIEPKLFIPTHYADDEIKYPVPQDKLEDALKILAMEPKEKVTKLRIKATDMTDRMQLVTLERS